jgi:carbon-monoxide dehydrogenase small subunit
VRCGFCTRACSCSKALLDRNLDPTEEEVREALAGNICRCTGYTQIVEAVLCAAAELRAAAVATPAAAEATAAVAKSAATRAGIAA